MKKKLALLVLAICTVMACSISFVACNITVPVDFELQFIVDGEVYATIDTAGEETISLPANPKKDGFEFDGWYWDENTWERPFTANSLLNEKLTSDMRVYAKWKDAETEKQEYVVTFNSMGGTAIDSVTVTEGSLLARPAEPSYTGFVFNGWYKDEDCTVSWVFETDTVTSSITLYAGWIEETATTFTVTYKDGETVLYTRKVAENNTAENIAVTKEGHTFKGWLLNNAEYDFTVPVTEDIILVAKWEINTYTVTFIADGVEIERFIVDYLDSVPEIPIVPAKTGYTGAWSITDFSSIAKNLTVTALYTAKTYTAAFDYANADGGNTIQNITLTYGQPVGALPVPTKADNTFYGWFYEGTQVTASTIWQTDTSAQITFTAKWLAADNGHAIISSDYFEFTEDDTVLRLPEKLRNLTETYDLIGKFTVSAGATWTAYTDESCSNDSLITREDLAPLTAEGWNNIYIQVKNQATREYTIYTLQIYRNKRIPVSLYYNESVLYKTAMLEETVPASDEANGDRLSFTLTDYSCDGNFYTDSACTNEWSTATVITEPISLYIKAYCHAVTVNSSGTVTGMSKQSGKVRLVIPESKDGTEITAIGDAAFKDKTNLIFVEVPGSVTKITFGAFSGCAALERISLPFVGTNANDVSDPYFSHPVFGEIFGATKYNGSISYDGYYIPTSLKSVEITGQYIRSYAFYGFTGLENIFIGSNVEQIARYAFSGCTNLNSIHISDLAAWCNISFDSTEANPLIYTNNLYVNEVLLQELIIPEGVTDIKAYSFRSFRTLKSITIPSTVENIESYAFDYCTGLTEIIFNAREAQVSDTSFDATGDVSEGINVIIGETVVAIPDYLFSGTLNIKNVKIGSNVTSIGTRAFYNCSKLTEINIPNSVTNIGEDAFYRCSSLTGITIPEKVTSIGEYAFAYCTGLTTIRYNAEEVTSVSNAFYCVGTGTAGIDVIFGDKVSKIPSFLFYIRDSSYRPNIKSVTIGNSVSSIGEYAFAGCDLLTSITIPDSVTSIGDYAFSDCTSLTSITIPDSVTSIGASAFNYCIELTEIIIPEGVTQIEDRTFYMCESLKRIVIPASVISIGSGAFSSCKAIEHAEIPTVAIPLIRKDNLKSVIISGGEDIPASAFSGCTELLSIVVENGVKSIGDSAFNGCVRLKNFTIPNGITKIGNSAFKGCVELTNFTIPDSIENIGDFAFEGCTGLTSINIPNSVVNIGNSAFYNCNSITSVSIGNGVKEIGSYAFAYCDKLIEIKYKATAVEKAGTSIFINAGINTDGITVIFAENVTLIPDNLFDNSTYGAEGAKIISVTIGKNVENIGEYAFLGCQYLAEVIIPNNVQTIGKNAFSGNVLTLYCEVASKPANWNTNWNGNSTPCPVVWDCKNNDVADDGNIYTIVNGLRYALKDNKATVVRQLQNISGDIEIPLSLNYNNLNYSVTKIASSAFAGCAAITSIVLPNSIESIENSTFRDCTELQKIVLSKNLQEIGYGIIDGCDDLAEVYYPGDIASWCAILEHDTAFSSVSKFYIDGDEVSGNIVIPEGVEYIGVSAFEGCDGIKSILLPSTLEIIYADAFSGCTNLMQVTFSENGTLRGISGGTFNYCTNLSSIEIPSTVTTIYGDAFYGCTKLENVHIEDITAWCSINFYDENANPLYHASNLYLNDKLISGELSLPESVSKIDDYVFYNYNKIEKIIIPSTTTEITENAFFGCDGLQSFEVNEKNTVYSSQDGILFNIDRTTLVRYPAAKTNVEYTVPDIVTEIQKGAFQGSKYLQRIIVPNSVTSIGGGAFSGCSSLESITLPFVGGYSGSIYPLGYIFGSDSYSGGVYTRQTYLDFNNRKTSTTYYIPESLKEVIILRGTIKYGAFYNCGMLKSITLSDSISNVGNYAFYGCNSLESISVPASAIPLLPKENLIEVVITGGETIEANAFKGAAKLISITIADSIVTIGARAFEDCILLENATIPALAITCIPIENLNTVVITSGSSIGERAFSGCRLLTSVEISESVTSIGNYAFSGCSLLTSINIPSGVTSIGEYAFNSCSSLASISIPEGVTSIGEYAFNSCSSLASISIPESVTSIGQYAFQNCTGLKNVEIGELEAWCNITFENFASNPLYYANNLLIDGEITTNITIPDGVTEIKDYAFEGLTNLVNVSIPEGVTRIGDSAFSDCSELTDITIPEGVTSIGTYAFFGCSSLTSIEIPASVTTIGFAAFYVCGLLESVAFGENSQLTSIEGWAFHSCRSLVGITIPDGVTSIGERAFVGCSNLANVTIGNGVTTIGKSAFNSCYSLTSVTIPASVTTIGESAFSDCYRLIEVYNLSALSITAGSSDYGHAGYYAEYIYTDTATPSKQSVTEDGYVFYVDGDKRYLLGYVGTESEIMLPENCNGGAYAIYAYAFYRNTSLTSVTIPDSVTSIGDYAFRYCDSLTSVTIGDGVTSIGNYAFENCDSLTSVTVGDSVTSIGKYAFYNCRSLTSIVIPSSITSIENYTFYNCDSLESIYYTGTAEEWSSIIFNSGNDPLTSATVYYLSNQLTDEQKADGNNYWHYVDGVSTIWTKETT